MPRKLNNEIPDYSLDAMSGPKWAKMKQKWNVEYLHCTVMQCRHGGSVMFCMQKPVRAAEPT